MKGIRTLSIGCVSALGVLALALVARAASAQGLRPWTGRGSVVCGRSAPGGGHQMLGIALALDLNLGRGTLDFGEVLRCQLDVRRAEVFLQPMQLGSAGNRHDPRLLREQPSERDLRRRRLLLCCDALEQIDEGLVLFHRLRREAREILAEIVVADLGVLGYRTCQEALAKRAVAHEANAELLARFEDAVGLRSACPQANIRSGAQ